MKVFYVIRNFGPVGGHKVMLQHVKILREAGIDSRLFVLKRMEDELFPDSDMVSLNPDPEHLQKADALVFTKPSDIRKFYKRFDQKGPVFFHLCQGYEPIDLQARISEESVPVRYRQKEGLPGKIVYTLYKMKFKRKIKKIETIYGYRTGKMAVSEHLKELIEKTYNQKCYYIPNGIDRNVFSPKQQFLNYDGGDKIRILSVGPMERAFKGIPDVIEAVRVLKQQGLLPLEFIRVSPFPLTPEEIESGLVDRSYVGISESEMAELYRKAHVFVSSSLEGEGFGLPAVEAMSCGTPCILTRVTSYLNFDAGRDYAFFVQPHSPLEIVDGIKKIIEDQTLREKLICQGFSVAEKYCLKNTAESLLKAFNDFMVAKTP